MKHFIYFLLITLGSGSALTAHALKADAGQPTHIEAAHMSYEDLKQENIFAGKVVLTRGTLQIKGDKMLVRQDPSGYQYGTAFGKPALFRQQRDGGANLWINGQAERIEYDTKTGIVRFFNKAKLKRLNNSTPTDEIEGAFILYNSRTEHYSVNNKVQGEKRAKNGRIKVVIQPNKK